MPSELKSNIQRRKRYRAKKELGRKRLVILAGAVIGLYLVFLFGKLHWTKHQMDRELSQIETRNNQIVQKSQNLKIKKKKLQDIDYIKNEARTKLYLMETNEVPIKIREKTKPAP